MRIDTRPMDPRGRARRRWLLAGMASPLLGCSPGAGMLAPTTAVPVDYASGMRQALRSFASDMSTYYFRATPVGNFGVGSIYLEDVSDPMLTRVESNWFLGGPDTWLAPTLPPAQRQGLLGRMVVEGSLGTFSVNAASDRSLHAQAGIAILTALVGNASVDFRKGVQTSFQASDVRNRRLNWAEFEAALQAGHISPNVANVVRQGNFVLAAADVVLTGYRAEVSVDESLNPALSASLRTNILLPQLRGGSAGFSIGEATRGHFIATATQPVVAAILFKRPPPQSKSILAGGTRPNLDAWPSADLGSRSIDAVEARVLEGRR